MLLNTFSKFNQPASAIAYSSLINILLALAPLMIVQSIQQIEEEEKDFKGICQIVIG